MKEDAIKLGLCLGALTSIPVMLVSYLVGSVAGLPFVPFVLFDFMARVLPGFILVPSIHLMVTMLQAFHVASLSKAAKLSEQCMGLVLFLVVGALGGGVLGALSAFRKGRKAPLMGALVGAAGAAIGFEIFVFMAWRGVRLLVSTVWLAALFVAWGSLVGWQLRQMLFGKLESPADVVRRTRRAHMIGTVGVAFVAAVAGLACFLTARATAPAGAETVLAQPGLTSGEAASPAQANLSARIEPAPGTRREITALKDFYRIDIDTTPPRIDASTWRLEVGGLVEHPMSLSLQQIRARPSVSQYATMSCISNPIGGPLISTGLWTGVPLVELLKEAGLKPGATQLHVEAADGFYETVSAEDMVDRRTLLVYALNGQPLSAEQGFPLRFFIRNRYGMKQPKWITRIEAVGEDGQGYWVDRGWDEAAIVQTTSVIDAVAVDQPDPRTGAVPIGGVAYAGDRGISKVEVQIDNGSWMEAQLRVPALSPLTWVQWRYDWPPAPGRHTVRVRATDGKGVLQTPQEHDDYPSGATGYHSVTFEY